MAHACVHARVFKLCVQDVADELKIDEFPLQIHNDESKEKSSFTLSFAHPKYIGLGLYGHI